MYLSSILQYLASNAAGSIIRAKVYTEHSGLRSAFVLCCIVLVECSPREQSVMGSNPRAAIFSFLWKKELSWVQLSF